MKRILFITSEYPPGPGGIGNQAYNIVKRLQAAGYTVRVLTEKRQYRGQVANQSIHYVQRGYLPFIVKFIWSALYLTLTYRPETIFYSGTKSHLVANLCRVFSRATHIAIYHGHEWHMSPALAKKGIAHALARAGHVVTVSAFAAARVQTFCQRPVQIIPNGIDLQQSGAVDRQPRNRPSEPLKLLTVGSLSARKGQMNVVRAMPALVQQFPDIEYHMAGVPLLAEQLQQLAHELGVARHIYIHGMVDDQSLAELYRQADIFVMLSENMPNGDAEGFGIAILEANAHGLPAIGSAGTGIEEAIADGVNGLIVHANEPHEILAAVKQILRDYREFSEKAANHVKQYSWDSLIGKYLSLIN